MIDVPRNIQDMRNIACQAGTLAFPFSNGFWEKFLDSLDQAFPTDPIPNEHVEHSVNILFCLTRDDEMRNPVINENIRIIKNLCSSHKFLNTLNESMLNYDQPISVDKYYWKFIQNLLYARAGNSGAISRTNNLNTILTRKLFTTLGQTVGVIDLANETMREILNSMLSIIQTVGKLDKSFKVKMIGEGVGTSLLALFVKVNTSIQGGSSENRDILYSVVSAFINIVYTDDASDKGYIAALLREATKGEGGAAALGPVVQALDGLRIYALRQRDYKIGQTPVNLVIERIRADIVGFMRSQGPPSSGISGLASVRTGPASVVSSLGRPLPQRPGTFGTGTRNAPLGRLGARHIVGRGGKRRTVRRKTRNIRHYKNGRSRRNS